MNIVIEHGQEDKIIHIQDQARNAHRIDEESVEEVNHTREHMCTNSTYSEDKDFETEQEEAVDVIYRFIDLEFKNLQWE